VAPAVAFTLNGIGVAVEAAGETLLDALREHLGVRSAKDGCAPQGQCGCCTVLVDGQPRVACVTPVARVAGRSVVTVEGLDDEVRQAWGAALCATGGSQCGFCTPGIVLRLEALRVKGVGPGNRAAVDQALLAHLCRCTGWQTIRDAFDHLPSVLAHQSGDSPEILRTDELPGERGGRGRDRGAAAERAALEGGASQDVGVHVALGGGGFSDDTAPAGALVALRAAAGDWVVGETLSGARASAGKVQGRRTTEPLRWPVDLPPGDWVRTLQTTWVEPGYLEPDASWCAPGGLPASPLGNAGAFGGKAADLESDVAQAAARLAEEHRRPVRTRWTREDVVRLGPKRPPLAAGLRADGSGIVRLACPPGAELATTAVARRITTAWPAIETEIVVLDAGPPVSSRIRGAGWAEVAALRSSLRPAGQPDRVETPEGAWAEAEVHRDDVRVRVRAGRPLDEVVLRSYVVGATHQALGWVRSEGIAVGDDGVPLDLTIRSFGILRAVDVPHIEVELVRSDEPPVAASEAVLAAVAAAAWRSLGFPPRWPAAR